MRIGRIRIVSIFILAAIFAPGALAQMKQVSPNDSFSSRYLWTESFSGSTNSAGQVMSLDSTVGYVFSSHAGVDAGIPIYFVHSSYTNSTGTTTTTSNNGLGDIYAQLRLSFPNPIVNYGTVLTGAAPTGNTATGLSTGHGTYDWTNRVDRDFGDLTPFLEVGVGNSIPSTLVYDRPYQSYGHEAHFQGGASYRLIDWLTLNAVGYEVAPWGSQTIFSRVVGQNGPPAGTGRNGHGPPVFSTANQTTGGSGLAEDNGFGAGVNIRPASVVEFSAGYSHSIQYALDTFSFSIGVNVSKILRDAHSGK
jgi:hypothetical protein